MNITADAVTKKTFKVSLQTWYTSELSNRDKLQALLDFGFKQAINKDANKCNLTPLSDVLNLCKQAKSVPTKAVLKYIQAHVPVKLVDNEGIITLKKADKDDIFEAKQPSKTWYDFDQSHNDLSKIDPYKLARALVTKLNADKNSSRVTDKAAAKKVSDAINKLLSSIS